MTPAEYIPNAAYADGYGDAVLESEGAPPMPIWDVRVEHLCDVSSMDGSSLMYLYYHRYDSGWQDGAQDAFVERSKGKVPEKTK